LKLNNPWAVFIAILALLAAFALYRSEVAFQHRSLAEAFILMVIAVIFVKRIQKRH
jgi:high-affinity Fe2+/Pb2+ permease